MTHLLEVSDMDILIVEGLSDKYFLDYLLKNVINRDNVTVEAVNKVEIIEIGGLGNLPEKIGSKISVLSRQSNNRMGIVVDLDNEKTGGGYEKRLQTINDAVQKSFSIYFQNQGKSVDIENFSAENNIINILINDKASVEITYYFIHLDGKGELEDILREIKIHNSFHADCVDEGWRCCLKQKGLEKTDKEINKTWLDYYIRHDILSADERRDAKRTCNLGYVLNDESRKGKIFNFEHEYLKNLKDFLKSFQNKNVILE